MPRPTTDKEQRVLSLKDDDHNYGYVTKKLGGSRFAIKLNLSEKTIIGRLCGKFKYKSNKKNNWVDIGTVVLVGMREFQDNVADIVHVYTSEEVRQLRRMGELVEDTERTVDESTEDVVGTDNGFDFDAI